MRRRHTTALIASAALAALTLTGCGAVDKALGCVQTADAIATSVDRLTQAASNAGDPTQLEESLSAIDKELAALDAKTGDADLSKAVDDLAAGVEQVRTSVRAGDTTPDLKPVTDAAAEVGKVCTP
ncbi:MULTISPECIES: hypothetical protein [Streptomyces]|jgi:hypothetical protein|uniref:Secreted protein n=2 Tax=Streptomyces TaxID=1883 RepID=A0A1D8G0V7_9ACTN|nr:MULTISPECIES: hypothetical protein [Streptomyces]AOT59089.1 hypothetical protein A4G23_01921 [Streptomyces rubrolavendulae]KAF0646428.1 hypothetical protein K701_28600 [Streptomyces fradiae ATCC 10745 = DSM 40063]OSY52899.1 hypothetical protein BG846_01422 [Streptomyces fradiae ATCC 10745 = DSM 40063]QEV12414.1 hypothetical protein CP974_10695 [Streptomyces fradiae ATCC 10745 = DSM 40063]UQS32701.1 hypothetical protein J5J01_12825 [Streptomyces fradiae]